VILYSKTVESLCWIGLRSPQISTQLSTFGGSGSRRSTYDAQTLLREERERRTTSTFALAYRVREMQLTKLKTQSMPERIAAVITADGWYTRY